MKVVHLISGLRGGGAETMVLQLCRKAAERGDLQMEVVVMSNLLDILPKFQVHGIKVYHSAQQTKPRNSTSFFGKIALSFIAVRRCIKARPDILHAHMYHAAIAAVLVKIARPATSVVFSLHNSRQPGWLARVMLALSRSFRNLDLVFDDRSIPWYLKANSRRILNGVDPAEFNSKVSKLPVFTFLFAGRLEKSKNPLALIPFARELSGSEKFQIIIAGDGSLKTELEEQIARNGLMDIVLLAGYTSEASQLIMKSHCVVIPSLWEGMPLVLLEAAAAGTPVIISSAANSSHIVDESTGYIVEPSEITDAARQIISNYEEALRKSSLLREKVLQNYTVDNAYTAHYNAYSDLKEIAKS
jgi:glycosyltransferase involved in cell wall biosynthesis